MIGEDKYIYELKSYKSLIKYIYELKSYKSLIKYISNEYEEFKLDHKYFDVMILKILIKRKFIIIVNFFFCLLMFLKFNFLLRENLKFVKNQV